MANEKKQKSFIDNIVESIRNSSGVELVFGKPVDKQGVVIIPVARVKGGGGGGRGSQKKSSDDDSGEGMGFGFGVDNIPYGYIEIKDGVAEFKQVQPPLDKKSFIVGGVLLALISAVFLRRSRK